MGVNIFINDLYLDFSFSKEMSLERRFFVEIELNKKNHEILIFMNEMNSAFLSNKRLSNKVILDNRDIVSEFAEEDNNKTIQSHKELLIIEKENIFSSLKSLVTNNLESREEKDWLAYCKKRYKERNVEFTQENEQIELFKFHSSNETIKQIWSNFPSTFKQFSHGGDVEKADKIPEKFSYFWTEAHFLHLDNKYKNKSIKEKKPKI